MSFHFTDHLPTTSLWFCLTREGKSLPRPTMHADASSYIILRFPQSLTLQYILLHRANVITDFILMLFKLLFKLWNTIPIISNSN